jgi:hypothetical protein
MVARHIGAMVGPGSDAPSSPAGHTALSALAREHALIRRDRRRGRECRAAKRTLARLDRAMRRRRGTTVYVALLAAAPVFPDERLFWSRGDPLPGLRVALARVADDRRLATAPRLAIGGVTLSLVVIGTTPVFVQGVGQWRRAVRAVRVGRSTTRRAEPRPTIVTAQGGAVDGRDELRARRVCAEAQALLRALGTRE